MPHPLNNTGQIMPRNTSMTQLILSIAEEMMAYSYTRKGEVQIVLS